MARPPIPPDPQSPPLSRLTSGKVGISSGALGTPRPRFVTPSQKNGRGYPMLKLKVRPCPATARPPSATWIGRRFATRSALGVTHGQKAEDGNDRTISGREKPHIASINGLLFRFATTT